MPRACGDTRGLQSSAESKRQVWKDKSVPSERDSLLTNSGDETFSSSIEQRSRSSPKLIREEGTRNDSSPQDGSNRLKVPFQGGKNLGFYSTSPSTDEGIVTDSHPSDERTRKSGLDEEEARLLSRDNCFQDIYVVAASTIQASDHVHDSLHRSNHYDSTHEKTTPSYSEKSSRSYKESYLHDNDQLNPAQINLVSMHPSGRFVKKEDFMIGEQEVTTKKRQSYRKRGQAGSDATEYYFLANDNHNVINHSERMTTTRKKEIWHQQSLHVEEATPQSYQDGKDASWTSASSCCELRGNDVENPVIVFSRSRNEIRSSESRLPALFERHGWRTRASGPPRANNQSSNDKYWKSAEVANTKLRAGSSNYDISSSNFKKPPMRSRSQADTIASISSKNPKTIELTTLPCADDAVSFMSNETSVPSSGGNTPGTTTTLKAPSRTGSTGSALAGALSSVAIATATGSCIPGEQSCKEKQKSLSERLMTAGPSDPHRVQGIVEDILCEMGEERIVQYKEAFSKFDKHQSGIISSKQLRTLLRTLGHNPSDVELSELINQVDMDENGKIDFNEFIIMIGYFDKANNENEDLANIFRVFDRDGRGCIDVDELRTIWNNYLQDIATDDSFEEMIRVIDNDGNGEINRMELLELLSMR